MEGRTRLHDRIEHEVRALLACAPGYRELSDEERARLAADTTRMGVFLAGQDWLTHPAPATDAFRELIKAIDFPDFVSSLIEGVFGAIVDASVKQLRAYGELVAAVSKSLNEFVEEHVSDAEARDHLEDAYPGVLDPEPDDDHRCKDREVRLVAAARRQLVRQRQQLLATMVLMGINRIVVTDG